MKIDALPHSVQQLLVTLLFGVITKVGLEFSFVDTTYAQIWSPTGLSIVVLYFLGNRFAPAIFIGSAVNYIVLQSSFPVGIALAFGSTLEAYIGCTILKRTNFNPALRTLSDIWNLVFKSGATSALLSALIGVSSVSFLKPEVLDSFFPYVALWWMGNFVGVIVVAPMLFLMFSKRFNILITRKILELCLFLMIIYGVSHQIFHGDYFSDQRNYSLAYILFPFAIWSTIRFGIIGSVTTTYVIALNATLSSQTGLGIFASEDYATSIFLVDLFVIVLGSTLLFFAALIEERTSTETSIRKSEESYRMIAERTGQLIYDYNVDSGKIAWSGAIVELTQYTPQEFAEFNINQWAEFIHPDDREGAEKKLEEAMTGHHEYNIEYRFRKKDGTYFDVHDRGTFLYRKGTDAHAYRMLGTMADVSHVNDIIQKLKENEERYKLFSLLTSDYIYSAVVTEEGMKTEWASDSFHTITGYTAGELEEQGGWITIIHRDDYEKALKESAKALQGETVIMEYRITTKSGDVRWLRDYIRPIIDKATGKVIKNMGGVQDITDRKRAEEKLKSNEERFRMLIEKSADAIVLFDRRGRIKFSSSAVLPIIGRTPEELLNVSAFDLAHPKDKRTLLFRIGRILFTPEKSITTTTRFQHKNGSWISIEGSVTNLLSHPSVNAMVVNFRDVTQRINADERLKRSLNEKEILLKEVHHRVKNNMQVISSLLNLQTGFLRDKHSVELFRDSRNRVKSMALVHEILYNSKDIASVNFSSYVKQLLETVQQSFGAKASTVSFDISIRNIILDIDTAIPCGLIINELVSNSLKYAFPKKKVGQIVIAMKKQKEHLQLSVSDNGIGISKKNELNESTLGLQLVQALTEQLKGTIVIESKRGTTITIDFPLKHSTEA